MCNKVYTLDEIRSIAAPIAKDYGVDALYLFGSYARGDATPESDMDFRIDKGSVCSVFKLGGLYNEMEHSCNHAQLMSKRAYTSKHPGKARII